MTRMSGASSKAKRKAFKIHQKAFRKTVRSTTRAYRGHKRELRARKKRALKYDRPISLRKGPHLIDPEQPFMVQREAKDYESTAVYYFDYDHETRSLLVQFWRVRVKDGVVIKKWASNKKYLFKMVGPEVYEKFVKAGSKGRFFLTNIRNKYNFIRV